MLGLLAGQGVGIRGAILRGVQHDTLAAHEVFGVVVAVVDVEGFAVEDDVIPDVQVFPQPVFACVMLCYYTRASEIRPTPYIIDATL